MWCLLTLVLCAGLSIVLLLRNKNKDYWKKRNVVEVHGVLKDFIFGSRSLAEVYKDIYEQYPKEPYVGIALGPRPALLLRDLENIQAVLAGDFQSFFSRGLRINPNDTLGNSVLFIDDFPKWRLLRQKLSPVFTSAKLKNTFYILNRCGKDFVGIITENPETLQKPFEAMYTYTTASIAASVFGIDAQVKNTMNSPFLDMSKSVIMPSFITKVVFSIGNTFPRLLSVFNTKVFGDHEEFFIGVVREVMSRRRTENEKRYDFIDICIQLQDEVIMKDSLTGYELEPTVEVLAAQAFFFFVAGADTSANAMHFTLLELSNNPDVLKKVHQEIDEVFGDREDLTYNDIDKLEYMEMVINEALRKYPPVGLVQRRCTKETTLPNGGAKIEKDCLIVVPVFALHRDEKYFPNPEHYDPERFSPANKANLPQYAFIPFGDGNRNCIGMRFARLQVKAGLAWLLHHYTLLPQSVTPTRFEASVFALRVPGVRYDLVPRSC